MIFKRKKREVISLEILAGICVGCERCVNRCKNSVFIMGHMEHRSVAAIYNSGACTGCGKCVSACRVGAIELITN